MGGATERIDSVVNSHDAVKTSVKTSIGTQAFVYWLASTNGEQYTASGNITYGTHSGQPHSMEFMTSGFIYDNLLVDYGTIRAGTRSGTFDVFLARKYTHTRAQREWTCVLLCS